MTIRECIDRVDNAKPNQYGNEEKVRWLSFLDGIIINEVLKTHDGYEGQYDDFVGYSADKQDVPLIVPAPYDIMYEAYLKMKIDEENGETARYNNSMTIYNTYLAEYKKWYNKSHMPIGSTGARSASSSSSVSLTKENIITTLGYTPAKEGDYATPDYVKSYAQPKGEYVTEDDLEDYSKQSWVGTLASLTTAVKDTIVGAINWLHEKLTSAEERLDAVEVSLADVPIPLLLSDWVAEGEYFVQNIAVEGLGTDCSPLIALSSVGEMATEDELYSYACIYDVVVTEGNLKFIASEKPPISFTVIAKGVVAGEGQEVSAVTSLVAKVSELETDVDALQTENTAQAEQITKLNSEIEYTTTKVNVTAGAHFENASYKGCFYKKVHGMCVLHIAVKELTANTATVIGILPSGYRPLCNTTIKGGNGESDTGMCNITVDTVGRIYVNSTSTMAFGVVSFVTA